MTCCYCSALLNPERVEVTGYTHCSAPSCVAAWRRDRINTGPYVLATLHKQGQVWMKRTDVPGNSMRRDGGIVR